MRSRSKRFAVTIYEKGAALGMDQHGVDVDMVARAASRALSTHQ